MATSTIKKETPENIGAYTIAETDAAIQQSTSDLVNIKATLNNCIKNTDYNPETKTSDMTKVVGKDTNGKLWTAPVAQTEVVSATESWLNTHVSPSTGYVVDDTLSIEGAAADAAACGELKSALSDFENVFTAAKTGTTKNAVILADGSHQSNSTWRTITISVNYARYMCLSGTFNQLNNSYLHIAFYNGKSPETANFISGIMLGSNDVILDNKIIELPENTQSICICDTAAYISTVEVKIEECYAYNRIADKITAKYLIDNEGRIISYNSTAWGISNYFPVNNNTKVILERNGYNISQSNYRDLCFYDEYGNVLQGFNNKKSVFDIPTGAKYCRYITQEMNDGHYLIDLFSGNEVRENPNYQNILLNYGDFEYTDNGLTFTKVGGRIYISGTPSAATMAQVLIFPISQIISGNKYKVSFSSVTNVYLQSNINTSFTTLSSGDIIEIPDNCVDAYIRVLVAIPNLSVWDTYIDVEITKEKNEIEEIHISTASDLYNFFYNFEPQVRYRKVFLDASEYDLYTGLYENYVTSDNKRFQDVDNFIRDVEIVGNGATIKIHIPDAVALAHESSANTVAGINVLGNVYIHDLTIDVENGRYALHEEAMESTQAHYTSHVYENVIFRYKRKCNADLNSNTVGMGGSLGQTYLFKNCQFYHNDITGYGSAFYCHGRQYNIEQINFENCLFSTNGSFDMRLNQYTGNDKPISVNIANCVFSKGLRLKPQASSGFNLQQYVLYIFNSYNPRLLVEQTNNYPLVEDPTIVNSIAGTISHNYDIQ